MTNTQAVTIVLGGEEGVGKEVRSVADLHSAIRLGFPSEALESVSRMFGLSMKELALLLGTSQKSLTRRRGSRLTPEESDRLFRFARVLAHALVIFEDASRVAEWLRADNAALGKEVPLTILDTDVGVQQVDALLGRIEHGIVH